jgi:prepilin-type N-terminal cleavage/methylation domain-containing protein
VTPFPPTSARQVLHSQSGFTLVEVMMAATILVVGFIGMIQALTIGSEMMATARRQTLATRILTHYMDELRVETYATIDALPKASTLVASSVASEPAFRDEFVTPVSSSGAVFRVHRVIAAVSGSSDLLDVTFTVTWVVRPSGITVSRTYTRSNSVYIARHGLNLRHAKP